MARAQTMDAPLIFVLGDPNYYGRFGFSTDAAATFECAYAGPHFMALRLSLTAPSVGAVVYSGRFSLSLRGDERERRRRCAACRPGGALG